MNVTSQRVKENTWYGDIKQFFFLLYAEHTDLSLVM